MKRALLFTLLIIYTLFFSFLSYRFLTNGDLVSTFQKANSQMIIFFTLILILSVFGVLTSYYYIQYFIKRKNENRIFLNQEIDQIPRSEFSIVSFQKRGLIVYTFFTFSLLGVFFSLLISLIIIHLNSVKPIPINWFMIFVKIVMVVSFFLFYFDVRKLKKLHDLK